MARKTTSKAKATEAAEAAEAAEAKTPQTAELGKPVAETTATPDNRTPAPPPEQEQGAAARPSAAAPAAPTDVTKLSAELTSEAGDAKTTSTAKPVPEQPADEPENLVVVVIGPKQGLWRAGRHFTSEPVRIPAVDLSEDEARLLRDEPKLAISLVAVDPTPE